MAWSFATLRRAGWGMGFEVSDVGVAGERLHVEVGQP